jgi:superfamily II DNA/RNA helicase
VWCQVLLFTATLPPEVEKAAGDWQCDPARLTATASGELISRSVTQVVQVCAEHKKPRKLLRHLDSVREAGRGARNPPRVLVFANRVKTVRFLAATLAEAGFKTAILHGERSQPEREVSE